MRAAYWLSFALTLTPLFMQIMGTFFAFVAITRTSRRGKTEATARSDQYPAWPLFLLAFLALALMLWQTVYVSDLFAGYSYGYDVESTEVLGVSISLELGENVNNFVTSAFSLLLNLWVIGTLLMVLFYARWRKGVRAQFPGWVFGILMLGGFVLTAWGMWRSLPLQIENLQAIF